MMPIEIKSIPHKDQRYETVGDFWDDEEGTRVRVSEMNNEDYEFCVAIHELIESYLCHNRGIKEEEITTFDMAFEAKRKKGNEDEPGDDSNAPYCKEHFFATTIERLLAAELGIDWKLYERAIMLL